MGRTVKSFEEVAAIATKKGIDVAEFEALRKYGDSTAIRAMNVAIKEVKSVKGVRGTKSVKSDPVNAFVTQHREALDNLLVAYRNIEDAITEFNSVNGTKLIMDMESPYLVKVKGARAKRNSNGATNGNTPATKTEYDWAGYAAKLKASKLSNRLTIEVDGEEYKATLQVNGTVKDEDGPHDSIRDWARTHMTIGNWVKMVKVTHNNVTTSIEKSYRTIMGQ